jgi:hypothetical protein
MSNGMKISVAWNVVTTGICIGLIAVNAYLVHKVNETTQILQGLKEGEHYELE